MAPPDPAARAMRQAAIRRVLWVEGASDVVLLAAKTAVGLGTSSTAVLGDAIHSLADLANNAVGLVALRLAAAPPDREHPYGHRRYESLAVFGLATMLAVLAFEIASRGLAGDREVIHRGWGLALMLGVLGVNVGIALWELRQARRLDSDLLRADSRHTLSDVLVTSAVIVGWQLAARGHAWLDGALTVAVGALILTLAYGLFRRAIPVLVDHVAVDPEELDRAVRSVPGVRSARRLRSRAGSGAARIDVVVSVDRRLSTAESHEIADAIEHTLGARFGAEEVSVHVEPE
jgi:cation diffusion facilitator family transporter